MWTYPNPFLHTIFWKNSINLNFSKQPHIKSSFKFKVLSISFWVMTPCLHKLYIQPHKSIHKVYNLWNPAKWEYFDGSWTNLARLWLTETRYFARLCLTETRYFVTCKKLANVMTRNHIAAKKQKNLNKPKNLDLIRLLCSWVTITFHVARRDSYKCVQKRFTLA